MPVPIPLIAAGIGALSTAGANASNRRFSRDNYRMETRDRIKFWEMQNEYNAPVNQVSRLQEAGLSPALMYGKSASPGVAGPVSNSDHKPVNNRPIFGENTNVINSIYDTRIKQAQIDNLKTQATVMEQDAILKAAQTGEVTSRTNRSVYDLEYQKGIRQMSMDYLQESVREKSANIDKMMTETERSKFLLKKDVNRSATEYLQQKLDYKISKKKLELMVEDLELKKLDKELAKKGIYRHDPPWLRAMIQNMDKVIERIGKVKLNPFK